MSTDKGMKPRIAILGAGALTSRLAGLLESVAELEVAQPQEEKSLIFGLSRSPQATFLGSLPKEKAQWKRERQKR